MSVDRLLAVFRRQGYLPDSFIEQERFYMLMEQQLRAPFDRDVGRELWEEADPTFSGGCTVRRLCEIIDDAQNILVGKTHQTEQRIQALIGARQALLVNPRIGQQQRTAQLGQLSSEIADLERDIIEFKEDLHFISAPFGLNILSFQPNMPFQPEIPLPPLQYGGSRLNAHSNYTHTQSRPSNTIDAAVANLALRSDSSPLPLTNPLTSVGASLLGVKFEGMSHQPPPKPGPNNQLVYMFWITILLCMFEAVVMFRKYNFVNLLVVCCVISIFLLNYFDQHYVRACVGLTGLSIFIDLLWLFLNGSTFWAPPVLGEFANSEKDYLRLIVVFTILSMLLKVPLVLLLFRHKDISQESNYVVDIGRMHVYSGKRNPVSQTIAASLPPSQSQMSSLPAFR